MKNNLAKKILLIGLTVISVFTFLFSSILIYGFVVSGSYIETKENVQESILNHLMHTEGHRAYGEFYELASLGVEPKTELDASTQQAIQAYFTETYEDTNLIIHVYLDNKEVVSVNENKAPIGKFSVTYAYDDGVEMGVELNIDKNLTHNDRFKITFDSVGFLYGLRFWVYPILISAVITLITCLYLLKNSEKPLRLIDKIYLEIPIIFTLMTMMVLGDFYYYDTWSVYLYLMVLAIVVLILCSTLSRRYRHKTLKQSSILYRFCRFIKESFQGIRLFWRAGIFFVLLFILEFTIVAVSSYYSELFFIFMFLLVKNVLLYLILLRYLNSFEAIKAGTEIMARGDLNFKFDVQNLHPELKLLGSNLNLMSHASALTVEEQMKSERMKTDLITNVSHDIKTPLTSIINYIDLLSETEDITQIKEYTEVLVRQSDRLKHLVEDLIDASKLSSGNVVINKQETDLGVLLTQIVGEYTDKMQTKSLNIVMDQTQVPLIIQADGQQLSRMIDNLLENAYQYAMDNSRIYIDVEEMDHQVLLSFKNMSKDALNMDPKDLLERFTRGDASRNTEGSGLGLSIAQSIVELHHGTFDLEIDGDLFKVKITLPIGS